MHDAPAINELVRGFLNEDYAAIDPQLPGLLALLQSRNAAEDWHKHGTFKDHLLGVYRILRLWNQPANVCLCGLLHSVYSNEYVDLALFDSRFGRDALRNMVGDEAEELIYLFCTMPRSRFAADLLERDRVDPAGMVLHDPADNRETRLTRDQVGIFIVVTLADLAEQWFSWQDDVMAGYPFTTKIRALEAWSAALWPGPLRPSAVNLSLLSRLARHLRDVDVVRPPIFDGCTGELSREDEAAALSSYWQVVDRGVPLARTDQARLCLAFAIERNPWIAEPHLLLAQLSLIEGDHPAAGRHARRGLELLLEWGTAWDKRIPWNGWVAWARILMQHAQRGTWPQTLRDHNNLGLVVAQHAPADAGTVA